MENKKIENSDFIGYFDIDTDLCKNIITFFEKNNESHRPGVAGFDINEKKKKSIDMTIEPTKLADPDYKYLQQYLEALHKCYQSYKKLWPFLEEIFEEVDTGSFNLQKYNEGGHFSKIHCERDSINTIHRLFAFMTYLNDDFDGGNTFFSHYNLSIKPIAGKTLIWPAEWTHAHKGEVVNKGTKYIATGWLNIPLIDD